MTTYPLNLCATKINHMQPYADGYTTEIMIELECSDTLALFDNITADGLQQELFEYLKKNFDKDFLKESLCI